MRGMLVTFEGQDGCGKSTLLPLVEQILSQGGVAVVTVPEFSNGIVGRFLQETLLHSKFLRLNIGGLSAITKRCMFYRTCMLNMSLRYCRLCNVGQWFLRKDILTLSLRVRFRKLARTIHIATQTALLNGSLLLALNSMNLI